MDNVTHTLAGLLIGEAGWQARRMRGVTLLGGMLRGGMLLGGMLLGSTPPGLGFRTAAAISAVVAANLPDVDVPYAVVAGFDKLGSLLHHRGYTHTLLAVSIGIVATWGCALALWRWKYRTDASVPDSAADRGWLFAVIAVAAASRLLLDWTNDYGIHPFSPANNAWHYGDTIFIVEPWLWIVAIPPLLFAARHTAARVVLGLVLGAGLALAWGVSLVPWGVALALTVAPARDGSRAQEQRLADHVRSRAIALRQIGLGERAVRLQHERDCLAQVGPRLGERLALRVGARQLRDEGDVAALSGRLVHGGELERHNGSSA